MKTRLATELEIRLLVQLADSVKAFNPTVAPGRMLGLKCPCGTMILPPTPAIPRLQDSATA
jgi:hypothetical protein